MPFGEQNLRQSRHRHTADTDKKIMHIIYICLKQAHCLGNALIKSKEQMCRKINQQREPPAALADTERAKFYNSPIVWATLIALESSRCNEVRRGFFIISPLFERL
jgi:hypothetical protein